MDSTKNPYVPGAGIFPPEFAGRDELVQASVIALKRIREGLAAKNSLIVGLRGVGKTVLLNRIHREAEALGLVSILLESSESKSLPKLLVPSLHNALHRISRWEQAKDRAKHALGALTRFAGAMKLRYEGMELSFDVEGEPGIADSGDLEYDLGDLLCAAGEAAQSRHGALVLMIDEIQTMAQAELGAMIMAMHRVAQRGLPVALIGAGLPQLVARVGEVKSYAERMFAFAEIGPLERSAAVQALEVPARRKDVSFELDAIEEVIRQTRCYPYFLQEWGKHCWDCANTSPITVADARTATSMALMELDTGFFRVRSDQLKQAEKRYLLAMAELGDGPHRSGDVARVLGKKVSAVAPVRARLIKKGMIYSPGYGDTAFTVPLFDEYLRRAMPEGLDG